MGLKVYNTLTRQKEEFTPLHEGFVGMYVCGPTVYSHSHIGHGKSYVSFDVIVRYLRYLGYKVLYVQNITDVGHLLDDGEDRILKQSKADRIHPMQVAEIFARSYFEDMDKLGAVRADISPRATGHITEQIELTQQLVEKGFAYEANGSVYFDVRKFADYGKLSGRNLNDMMEGTRVESRSEKRHPADFALWKKAEPEHIMRWPSPWGEGFPGWHVECSAMSMKYLGESFDIHGGGLDNQFPHHECEIAQSVSATNKPFVKYWMHNNLVTVAGQKMSKSLGNFVTLKDAFKKYDPLVVRFFILQSHYRSTLDFSDEALNGARSGLEKLVNTLRNVHAEIAKAEAEKRPETREIDLQAHRTRYRDAMDDDFNTPQAIAELFDVAKDVNQALNSYKKISASELQSVAKFFQELGVEVLGILAKEPSLGVSADGNIQVELIQLLIDLRNEVRQQKLWALSDLIRDGLKKAGITIEDKKDGTVWKKTT
ncbi:MAG: cysteine--tRNA ligase [Ignavibacteriales bacterium]|nr:cysteine--tRNA ligase [Ignavibacteriales bacterium]